MTANALEIIHVGLTASLTRPARNNHPREQPELPQIDRTTFGAVTRDGLSYEPPHIWDGAFIVNLATRDILIVQHSAWRDAPTSFPIYDTITPYSEATQTRAAVPGTTPATLGGRALYYPQFKGEFQGSLKITDLGNAWYQVNFQLIETEVVPVP